MTTLVVTECDVEKREKLSAAGMELLNWKKVQGVRPSDYEVVILDTRLAVRTKSELSFYQQFFEKMRSEIEIFYKREVL